MTSCYVHFPFCPHICLYCAFKKRMASYEMIEKWKESFIVQAKDELSRLKEKDPSFSLSTLYFGGGTPSMLAFDDLKEISLLFVPYLADDHEWTIEINPETLTPAKARAFAALGINRASVGIQTFNDRLLKKIGRKHSSAQAKQAIEMLKDAGISNISADLIYALPSQSLEDVKEDLSQFLNLDIDHLSIYSLQIEEDSAFGKMKLEAADEDLEADMFELIVKTLKNAGFDHYEISSFSKYGRYSRHNLAYWQDEDFMGLGYGAWGREDGRRYENALNLQSYINGNHEKIYEENEDAPFEALMMALRTRFGIDLDKYRQKYGLDLLKLCQKAIEKNREFIIVENGFLKVNERGMELLNSILLDFMDAF